MPTINYLDKNGLSHFWDKINAKKQDKLTAGTNITISANNTISASQPTVGNGTLTIQKNGTNVATFTANQSGNATANIKAPVWVDLRGSAQTNSYHRTVIALCEVSTANNTSLNSFSSGRIVFHRDNGLAGIAEINVNMENQYTNAYYTNVSYYTNLPLLSPTAAINTAVGWRPCTFKYNNKYYGGVEVYIATAQLNYVYFEGESNFDIFGLDYYQVPYSSTAAQVLNQEVYSSLNYSQWTVNKGKEFFNNIDLYAGTITKNDTYTYTFPNKTGTVAMTSDIPSSITVDSALSTTSTNPVQNKVISTALNGKQHTLTAGSHIDITNNVIKAKDYVHSEQPVATQAVTPVVTGSMISNGTITADKLASGATVQLTLSNVDIGEGSALAANTLYGVYL